MYKVGAIFFLCCLSYVYSYKILCLMPMPGRSHSLITSSLCKELARRNHTVVAISAFPEKKPIPNYREVILKDFAMDDATRRGFFDWKNMVNWQVIHFMATFGLHINEQFMAHPTVKEMLETKEKFDLIYVEAFVAEAAMAAFQHKLKVPIVALVSSMATHWGNFAVGNPAPSSYIPENFLNRDTRMTFCQRVENFLINQFTDLGYRLYYLPRQDAILKKHLGNDVPYVGDIIKNISLVLVNHHHSLAYGRPYVPNMVEIGGFHVRPPQPLPKDLQDFLDNAKEGVIFFSLGSNIDSAVMPPHRLQIFLEVFSRLKVKVLWKFERDELPGKSDNVKISNWLPQSDVLAHPNMRLFITHGGLLSTIESVVRGVPLVGVPIFAEQPMNMIQAELAGFGRTVDFETMTADQLYEAVQDVLENPKYTENVKRRSALLNDTPLSAIDTAIYWIEYVIRHKGAPHMRSAAQDLSWLELYSLDVMSFLAVVTTSVLIVAYLLIRTVLRTICGGSHKKVSGHKKKD